MAVPYIALLRHVLDLDYFSTLVDVPDLYAPFLHQIFDLFHILTDGLSTEDVHRNIERLLPGSDSKILLANY